MHMQTSYKSHYKRHVGFYPLKKHIKKMKKYIFLDFKRWFYGALKFIAVYILMVMLFMAYFYWYPEKEMNNMNRRALMYQECLRSHFHWQK